MKLEFPKHWIECTFGQLLDYIQPGPFIVESTDYNDRYETPVLTAGKSFIKGYTNEKTGIFNKLPVIIFDDFTTATQFVNFPFKVKSSAMKILTTTSPEINIKFLYYLMQVTRINTDSHKRYWIGIYSKEKIQIPSSCEQKRIVAKIEELFSELDNGIAALKTAREQLKVYRQAVLKHAFEGKLTAQWRKDNADKLESPEQLLARIQTERETRYQQQLDEWKQAVKHWQTNGQQGKKPSKPKQPKSLNSLSEDDFSELPRLPDGYIYTYLANVGDLGRGKSKHRPRNDPRLFGGDYPFIQTAEVKAANRKINSYSQTYSEFGLEQSKLWPAGTLCITIAANIAETAFLGFDGCFPDSVVGFSAYNSVLPEYVELFIKAVRVRIESYAPATAQKNINLTTLENLVIPYCSINEQMKLINALESIFSVIDKNEIEVEQALERAESLRQSILKKAFSGQLGPQDPNDEPARELLARIQDEKTAAKRAKKSAQSNKEQPA
mgnify:CR=1 FL=1